jgi:tetratricopeptide (TPR) repeat protein
VKTKNGTGSLKFHQTASFIAVVIFFIAAGNYNQLSAQQKPSRQSSLEAFSKGDYEKAFSEFGELLIVYPKDPLYKYYSGVCLVNLKRNPDDAVNLLKQSIQNAAVVRSIPADAVFWLGRAQQLAGQYNEAITSYNQFTEQAGKKTARELGIPEFVKQCIEQKGEIGISEAKPAVPVISASVNSKSESKPVVREKIDAGYDKALSEALEYQAYADSLESIAEARKDIPENLGYKEKVALKAKITETERRSDSLQKLADIKYNEAQAKMNATPFVAKKDSLPSMKSEKVAARPPVTKASPDTVTVKPAIKPVSSSVVKSENVFSVFAISNTSATAEGEKIKINPEIPPGLIYRIQVAVFRNPVLPAYFKGITPVYGFRASGAALTTYYAGMFRRKADAGKALLSVKQKGFKDAFVQSFSEGKIVSAERAAILEKEWGKKPFTIAKAAGAGTPADTIPPSLMFRVEVRRSPKPLKEDVLDALNKLSANREMETVILEDKTSVYLIGRFITYESASEYADLLVRNGYKDAKVGAWLGTKEIPVETAKDLFENLK